MSSPYELSDEMPVYVISVAAELSGLHPQTLRAYDRLGLVSPGRSAGRGRRYSLRDILMLREVQRLSQKDGVNLSGIKRIIQLEAELELAGERLSELTAEPLLRAVGNDPEAVLAGARVEQAKLPSAAGTTLAAPETSRPLLATLATAAKRARELNDDYVSTEHLLVGLASDGGKAADLL